MKACFWRHKWGKWELIRIKLYYFHFAKEVIADRQQRVCDRCGFIQRKKVRGLDD